MLRFAARIVLVFLVGSLAVPSPWGQTLKPQGQRAPRKAAARKKAVPAPEAVPQPPPPPPPTLEQMPPTPPQVTYQNGMLTIVAQNSTLSDILGAVRARTGAAIELPAGSGAERVVARVGPLPPRDALDSLLEGSKFNYLILSSEQQPEAVQRVVLTVRPATAVAGSSPPAGAQPVFRPGVPATAMQADEGDDESAAGDDVPEPEPVQAEPIPQPQVQPGVAQPQAQPTQPNQNVKTPEQLLQELQRMQQQQQQQPRPPGQIPPEQEPQPPTPEQPQPPLQ